ncbi:MAG: endonuclease III [Synergistales bacterium]|nr:endonuclease III [Bacteroidales bacterium]MDY6394810.1 endonuclease III [Bacteroidales bacterium]MDY6423404.1 endonuclease III [Bacteroidales bacterium]MDY6434720.1 endonuclease III [Synergistales bacterium]
MKKQERYNLALQELNEMFPDAKTELENDSPFHLLVAVILSAQCTDKRVNMVTPELFKRYPYPQDMADSSEEEIFGYIKSISYPNSKAKYLKNTAKRLVEVYNGEVPSDINELQTLQGVGRKTANVIASVVFNQATMPVDTHVHRVSRRIGLTSNAKTVRQTEEQLMSNIPKNNVALLHHQLILLGRYICKARKPECDKCSLTLCCKFFNQKNKKSKEI